MQQDKLELSDTSGKSDVGDKTSGDNAGGELNVPIQSTDDVYVRVSNVAKSFSVANAKSSCVLKHISLDIRRGDLVSVIGRSGVGKSTLLRLVGALLPLSGGSVEVDGISALEAQKHKRFGFMPQTPALLPWRTILRNVSLTTELNHRRSELSIDPLEALRVVGLESVANALPTELSGGMQQRVGLARALVTRAPVLLLDEPFSSLDEITRAEMHEHVKAVRNSGDHTILLVTHNVTEAVSLSDKVVVLAGKPGRVEAEIDVRNVDESSSSFASIVEDLRKAMDVDFK